MASFDPRLLRDTATRSQRRKAVDIMNAALEAVDPIKAIRHQVRLDDDILTVGGRAYDLSRYQDIYVVGGGKAGSSMALAIEQILGDHITAGSVNVKYGYTRPAEIIQLHEAGHPLPDEEGVKGTEAIIRLLKRATKDDLVICLISGGGSALMVAPAEGITLADMEAFTQVMLSCGATINEINALRKHCSRVKGGQMARLAYPADLIALLLSDVVGSPLDVIASGPTVADTSTFADAWGIVERYGLEGQLPASIVERLRQGRKGKVTETPKPGEPALEEVYTHVVASNEIAAQAAVKEAKRQGFNTLLLSTFVEGEAREVAQVLAAIAKEIRHSGRPIPPPACVVAGGETTVTLLGEGKGGRNQELALAAAIPIAGLEDVMIIGLATDGTDGPTDAAGALADGTTVARAEELSLSAQKHLMDNDSYHFFEALGDLLITGPTNTNVNDLILVLVT
ncbi:MAG: glycerate kinase [Chloroflexota bacterium]|nr:glycerate kinase [Chloroflexota bacterium]